MLGLAVGVQLVATQSADFDPPRLSNGNPDFNGIWQVMNGIAKLTKIGVIDPEDIVVDLLRGPTCCVSESA